MYALLWCIFPTSQNCTDIRICSLPFAHDDIRGRGLVFNRHGVSHREGQGMLLMSVASLSLDVSEVSRIANLSEWSVVTNETQDFFENLFIKRYFVKRN